MNGNGVQLVSAEQYNTFFSFMNPDFVVRTSWISPEDGFLALDENQDGIINGLPELFGDATQIGFAELAGLDSNNDGIINSQDERFGELLVWQDSNSDAASQADELKTLSDWGISSISLANTEVILPEPENNQDAVNSNESGVITHIGEFTWADGSKGEAVDVELRTEASYSRYVGDYTLGESVRQVANIKGYGTMADLHIAMSMDSNLKAAVFDLMENATIPTLLEDIGSVLEVWAKTELATLESLGMEGIGTLNPETGKIDFQINADGSDRFKIQSFSLEQLALIQTYAGGRNSEVLDEEYHDHVLVNWPELGPAAYFEQRWNEINRNMIAKFAVANGLLDEMIPGVSYDAVSDLIQLDAQGQQTVEQQLDDIISALTELPRDDSEIGTQLLTAITLIEFDNSLDMLFKQKLVDQLPSHPQLEVHFDHELFQLMEVGGNGSDLIVSEEKATFVLANGGNDALIGSDFNDTFMAGNGHDMILAEMGDDTLFGGRGNDYLDGSHGDDTVYGGTGDDTLFGRWENDLLYGEAGYSWPVFQVVLQVPATGAQSFFVARAVTRWRG